MMTTFASQRDRIKAKLITIGKPGQEVKFVAPQSKPFVEIHWWVLGHKIKTALGVAFLLFAGAALFSVGWKFLLVGTGIGFVLTLLLARPCP